MSLGGEPPQDFAEQIARACVFFCFGFGVSSDFVVVVVFCTIHANINLLNFRPTVSNLHIVQLNCLDYALLGSSSQLVRIPCNVSLDPDHDFQVSYEYDAIPTPHMHSVSVPFVCLRVRRLAKKN